MNLFGTDGIRGVVGSEIDEKMFYKLGKAIAIFAKKGNEDLPKILVGMDTRKTGDILSKSLINGLSDEGVNIFNAKIISTPMMSYMMALSNYDYGLMITASHNSEKYNGLKIFNSNGQKIAVYQEEIISSIYTNLTENISLSLTASLNYVQE